MKLAELKRRIVVGTKLKCVRNTRFPKLNGAIRTVIKTQGNAFKWTTADDQSGSWTNYPKAAGLIPVDENTFRLALDSSEDYVELAFV